ncbi:HNH endonuclease [Oerskovia enterophila]
MQSGQHGPRCTIPNCPGCTPHPMRAEVDEIIPVSRGGSPYERSNTQLTHRICNQRKSDGRKPKASDVTGMPVSTGW